jgi:hypothetical protein
MILGRGNAGLGWESLSVRFGSDTRSETKLTRERNPDSSTSMSVHTLGMMLLTASGCGKI